MLSKREVSSHFSEVDLSGAGVYAIGPLGGHKCRGIESLPGAGWSNGKLVTKKCACFDTRWSTDCEGDFRVGMAEEDRGVGRRLHEHLNHFSEKRRLTDATAVWVLTRNPLGEELGLPKRFEEVDPDDKKGVFNTYILKKNVQF